MNSFSATTSIIAIAPPASVLTTTVFPNATSSSTPQEQGTSSHANGDAVPVAAIAGGAAGGVFLAVTAVLIWHWWGRSIKRKEDEKRKQAFAFFQLRENTRNNASSLSKTHDSYRPSRSTRSSTERKVKFVPGAEPLPPSSQSTLRSMSEKERDKEKSPVTVEETITPANSPAVRTPNHAPVRPSPLARALTPPSRAASTPASPTEPSQPLLTRPATGRKDTTASTSSRTTKRTGSTLEPPKSLAHKNSNASSLSAYSTQSGEERQMRVPPSLIMAALGRPDPPRAMMYSTPSRLSAADYDEHNRLSHISEGSAYLQHDDDVPDMPDLPVGYAR